MEVPRILHNKRDKRKLVLYCNMGVGEMPAPYFIYEHLINGCDSDVFSTMRGGVVSLGQATRNAL